MLRLVYADQGAKEDLLGAVQAVRGWAEGRFVEGREQVQGYLADGGPFPERLHIIALFARFYADLFELIIQWSELAEAEIQAWPRTDDLGMTERTRALLEELVSRPTAGHGAMHRPSAQQAGSHRQYRRRHACSRGGMREPLQPTGIVTQVQGSTKGLLFSKCLVGAVRFDKALNRLQVVREGCGSPLRLPAVAVVKINPYVKRYDRAIGEATSARL